MEEALGTALIAEAAKKSALLWVTVAGQPPRPAWHVWHDGAAYVVTGGIEQPLPGLAETPCAVVTLRSKDTGSRVVEFPARVTPVAVDSPEWDAIVPELHAKRLNAPDGEAQPARWAKESTILRLSPDGPPAEPAPTSYAAPPVDTPATTRTTVPFTLGRRRGKRHTR